MLGVVVAASAAACAFVIGVLVHEGLAEAAAWAGVVAAQAGVVATAPAVWVVVPRPSKLPLPQKGEVPESIPPHGWALAGFLSAAQQACICLAWSRDPGRRTEKLPRAAKRHRAESQRDGRLIDAIDLVCA